MTHDDVAVAPRLRAFWTYRRPFSLDTAATGLVRIRVGFGGLASALDVSGRTLAEDFTPATGPEAIRSHRLAATLDDGRRIEVEAGYVGFWSVGIRVHVDGRLVHESHQGRAIAFPALLTESTTRSSVDFSKFKKNRVSIAVDVALGFLFYVVAKLSDLQTAALVGAGAGLALVVIQRFVKSVDLLGGLALFGVFMLLASAGFAIAFDDDEIIKQRSTILGLFAASLFLADAVLGGRYLGARLQRYLPYDGIDGRRLAMAIGLGSIVIAGLNFAVARLASTDVWLFYSTFLDFLIGAILFAVGIEWARRGGAKSSAG